ncbi:hypothetical protein PAXRUDRAFT_15974 [Paxillus rubicundulus Ve08.2h10]|uniref:Uncharacterized protein n=1 Tax=Paxillus rubicundulus Ve08.2h10 TaxID=930991 RepID=A0A0D0DG04_9AGAM|nr:hypothetical protein PAXRUDRAFT_15974 [Paxillus rubicundulus Ve08.2h10]
MASTVMKITSPHRSQTCQRSHIKPATEELLLLPNYPVSFGNITSTSMSSIPEAHPLDGSLLFSDLMNFHVQESPTFPMFVYADEQAPNSTTGITSLEFGRVAHRMTHALCPARQSDQGQVVRLIAQTNTIHHATLAGMPIAGLVVPISS